MGRSVTASLVFGFYVDEKALWDQNKHLPDPSELPWMYDGEEDLERWWLELQDFENPVECPFDDDGEYLPGKCRFDAEAFFKAKRDFLNGNPPPWDEKFFGSAYSEATLFFAVRGSKSQKAYWGAEQVDFDMFKQPDEVVANAGNLSALMAAQGVPMTVMAWYLLAYEG